MDGDISGEPAGQNQSLYRSVNERLKDLNETLELLMFARFRPVQVVGIPIRLANALAWAGERLSRWTGREPCASAASAAPAGWPTSCAPSGSTP